MFGFVALVYSVLAALMLASWQVNNGVDGLMGVKTSNSTNGYPVTDSALETRRNHHHYVPDPNYNAVNDDKERGNAAFNFKITTGLMTTNAVLMIIMTTIFFCDTYRRGKPRPQDRESQ